MLATTTEDIGEDDFVVLGDLLDGLVPGISAKTRGLFPRIEEESEGSEGNGEGWDAFMSVSRGRRREDLSLAARTFVPRALRELVGGLGAAIEGEIRRLRYLGPLRSYPPRHLTFTQHHDPNWFAGGGYAWDIVRKRGEVRTRVNAWLGDANRLQTNYELVVRDLLPSDVVASELSRQLDGELHDLLASIIARVADREQPDIRQIADQLSARFERARDISGDGPEADLLDLGPFPELQDLLSAVTDTEALSQHLADSMVDAQPEELQDLVLVDQRTDTPVSHRDVGIGVSQVLPVLVSAYASTDTLLAIEQPEIHLHPALQAELGDVFIESALGEGRNTFLIETHSEHLLLRIMRRMRETSTGKLPDGVPEVRPEHVMVLFVEPDGARSLIREMPLNERGELVKSWPGGFFEEGLREIF